MTSSSGYSACAQAWALPIHISHIHWRSDLFLCGAVNSGLTVTTAMLAGLLMGDSLASVQCGGHSFSNAPHSIFSVKR